MKKIFLNLFIISFTLLFLQSCGEEEALTYDVDGGDTVYFFSSNAINFPVSPDVATLTVNVGVTTRSSSVRTFNVSVNEASTADASVYNLDLTSLNVPADSFNGSFSLSADINQLPDTGVLTLVLDLTPSDGYGMPDRKQVTISIFKSCPIPSTSFVGSYLIAELTPYVDGPTLDDGSVVIVSPISGSDIGRTFMTKNYPNYCTPLRAFNFDLFCGEVLVRADQASTCACTAAGLFFGPAIVASTYNVDDDTYFELTFTNDVTGDCSPAVQTTYSFTKQ